VSPPQRPTNVAASVRARLANVARARREDFGLVLTHYALERLLYRLSRSRYRDDFVLKGAMLFQIWSGVPHRPTRDLDLLGRGAPSGERLAQIFEDICREPVEEDGLTFREGSIRAEEIREHQEYQGLRITFEARLGNARIPIQIDVGFGDAIVPGPIDVEFPTLLGCPTPVLRAYSRETVTAEKFQAMVVLGMANSRMKDFYDVWVLCQHFSFDGGILADAIRATFERRRTPLPELTSIPVSEDFTRSPTKHAQWTAFLRKLGPSEERVTLGEVIILIQGFLTPPVDALREGNQFGSFWPVGGPWLQAEQK